MLHKEKLTITSSSDESIQTLLDSRDNCPYKEEIENALDNLLDISLSSNNSHITHPVNSANFVTQRESLYMRPFIVFSVI